MLSPQKILLGQSDFLRMRLDGGYYVDKSSFVSMVIGQGALVQVYPRPRRFGKTLNLSTLRYFLEKAPDRSGYFSDLTVWEDPEARPHFQRYPVIPLSFKDVKQRDWPGALRAILAVMAEAVMYHRAVLENPAVDAQLRARLMAIREETAAPDRALRDLCEGLAVHHQERVVILIDEYDAPLLSAWEHGYYEEAIAFFRSFFAGGLKDNPHLFRGVLTGILRVAKESMFSGLNNLAVYSLLHQRKVEPFGFVQAEVEAALSRFGREAEADRVRDWYNGYHFGPICVYNPWSILNFLAHPEAPAGPWWLNTSDNALVRSLLLRRTDLSAEFQVLLEGGAVEKEVDENVVLRDMAPSNLWSLLLFSGYLSAESYRQDEWGSYRVRLQIPNREVKVLWRSTFLDWLKDGGGEVTPLQQAILSGDAPKVEERLKELLLRHVSSQDVTKTQGEAFYHAFVLGMLVTLERSHRVRSNRETGGGRADLLLIPRQAGQAGVVLEFKRQAGRPKTLRALAQAALEQIEQRGYRRELDDAGAAPIYSLGIAFSGKEVVVCGGRPVVPPEEDDGRRP